jgi:hypothetical protein
MKAKELTLLQQASEYLRTGAKVNAVCYLLGIDIKDLEQETEKVGYSLADFIVLQKDVGEAILLHSQWELSRKNAQMAIHLGRVVLGQKEPEIDNKGQYKIFGIATFEETKKYIGKNE